MTQADLAPLPPVSFTGDRKISCETLADDPRDHDIPESTISDLPPESFWLSKDAEFDWFDRNAFLERKESIKGNSNSMNLNPFVSLNQAKANASSLHISAFLNSKAVQKMNVVDSKRRKCRLANILLFPKRSDSIGKEPAVSSMREPSSPKVSCLGRVSAKRCHRRRKVNSPVNESEKAVTRREKSGFMWCIRWFLRSDCYGGGKPNGSVPEIEEQSENSARRTESALVRPMTVSRDVDLTGRQPLDLGPRGMEVCYAGSHLLPIGHGKKINPASCRR